MRKGLLGLGVLGLVAGVCGARDARACGFLAYGGDEVPPKPIQSPPPERVASADRELARGRASAAASEVVRAFPRARALANSTVPLETRAARILALAIARTGGAPGVAGFDGSTERSRADNLAWAAGVLRARRAARADDPVAQAELAEVLERLPGGQAEALSTLRRLADRDLLGSPFAYASLARMQLAGGDAAAARGSILRCRAMTASPDAVCPPAPSSAVASR
jgi:hypothetical protein